MKKETPFPKSRIIKSTQLIEAIKESCDTLRYCFILGAGASISSGIKSGRELEKIWMKCLVGEEDDGNAPKRDKEQTRELAKKLYEEKRLKYDFEKILKDWEDGKDLSSDYYFDIYALRFHQDPHNGDRYLERIMEGKEPSFGYYILSFFMEKYRQNNLIITTNFDSLTEDALYLLSTQRPLVAGHESLARYISSDVKRPIVAKIHRSLFYEPFNSPQNTNSLDAGWRQALDYAFKTYVPIVIGYGGGDRSLMSFLEKSTTTMRHGIYWCYVGDNLPEEKIQKLIKQKNGFFVKIDGFDELMLEIGDALFGNEVKPESLEKLWLDQTTSRVSQYKMQLDEIKKRKSESVQTIVDRMEKEEKEEEQKRDKEKKLTYWDYIRRADRAMELNDYETIIEDLTNAIKIRPDNSLAYNNRGFSYGMIEKYDEAIKDLTRAIELAPDYITAYSNRGNTYSLMGKYDEAIRDYNIYIELKPDNAKVYNQRGCAYDKIGKYYEAIIDYSKAIELESDFAIAYLNRADDYRVIKRYPKAIRDYNKYIELNPDDEIGYNNRGLTFGIMGESEEAIKDYNKAIELNPDYAIAYNNRGYEYLVSGLFSEAIWDFNKAIKLKQDYAMAYNNRGYAYEKTRKDDKAIKDYKKAIELDSDYAKPHNHLGRMYFYQGKLQEAIEELSRAIEIDNQMVEAYEIRAKAYRSLKQNELAEKDEYMVKKLRGIDIEDT